MRVAVIGLGYVGAVTAVCLSRDGHEVVGVDLDKTKTDLLMSGRPPIIEEGLQEITELAARSGRFAATSVIDERVARCDVVFVCVGTPSAPNGSQSLTAVERVAEQIGSVLAKAPGFPVIVLRSTVPPGTTESLFLPALEKRSGKRAGKDFGVCFQPEFLREGSSVKDFYNPPFTVVGSTCERSLGVLRELFADLPAEFVTTQIAVAEMCKLACNAFHALKISFANEVGRLGRELGVDSRHVMDLVCRDRSLNISPAYLRPGFAFGGSCLPKDLRAMLYLAKHNDVELPMMQGIVASNSLHIDHAAELVKSHGSRRVGMLGLSFKPGTDDLRESPLVTLAEHLVGKGYQLKIYDPAVSLARLVGANKRYIEQTIPHLDSMLSDNLDGIFEHGDVVVVGFKNATIVDALGRHARDDRLIVDLVGVDGQRPAAYAGICW